MRKCSAFVEIKIVCFLFWGSTTGFRIINVGNTAVVEKDVTRRRVHENKVLREMLASSLSFRKWEHLVFYERGFKQKLTSSRAIPSALVLSLLNIINKIFSGEGS